MVFASPSGQLYRDTEILPTLYAVLFIINPHGQNRVINSNGFPETELNIAGTSLHQMGICLNK